MPVADEKMRTEGTFANRIVVGVVAWFSRP